MAWYAVFVRRGGVQLCTLQTQYTLVQEFTISAINKDTSLDTSLKTAYKSGKYGVAAVIAGSGKVW